MFLTTYLYSNRKYKHIMLVRPFVLSLYLRRLFTKFVLLNGCYSGSKGPAAFIWWVRSQKRLITSNIPQFSNVPLLFNAPPVTYFRWAEAHPPSKWPGTNSAVICVSEEMAGSMSYSIVEYFGGDDGYRCGYCKNEKGNFSHGEFITKKRQRNTRCTVVTSKMMANDR